MSEILSRFEIAQQIPAQESFIMLDRVLIESPIKSIGEVTVQVKLHHDVTADLKVNVVRA